MTEEEKKATERIEETFYSNLGKGINEFQKVTLYEEGIEDIITALNLMEKQQKEIERNNIEHFTTKDCYYENKELRAELEKKDKIIEQLETDKQKLIEKLEKDVVGITKTLQDGKHWDDYSRCRLKAYRTKTKEILSIVKGEEK